MKVVLRCWSTHDDTCGCDYALVDLTPTLARLMLGRIRRLRRLERQDAGISDVRWWSGAARFFSPWGDSSSEDPDAQPDAAETERMEAARAELTQGKDLIEVPDDFEVPDAMAARTECDRMVVAADGVSFSCIPKHTDVRIVTGAIPLDMLERAANRRRGAKPKEGRR
jgi:hypothetical protein